MALIELKEKMRNWIMYLSSQNHDKPQLVWFNEPNPFTINESFFIWRTNKFSCLYIVLWTRKKIQQFSVFFSQKLLARDTFETPVSIKKIIISSDNEINKENQILKETKNYNYSWTN